MDGFARRARSGPGAAWAAHRRGLLLVPAMLALLLFTGSALAGQADSDADMAARLVRDWYQGRLDFNRFHHLRDVLADMPPGRLRRIRALVLKHPEVIKNQDCCAAWIRRHHSLMAVFEDRLGELRWDQMLTGRIVKTLPSGTSICAVLFQPDVGEAMELFIGAGTAGAGLDLVLLGQCAPEGVRARVYLKNDDDLAPTVKMILSPQR